MSHAITLLDNEFATLWYHPDDNIVHHQIHQAIPGPEFRALLTAGAVCLEEHHSRKWLSDDRKSVLIPQDDYEWGATVWPNRVIAAGFRFWAVVMPSAIGGRLTLERAIAHYRVRGVTIEVFDDPDRAYAWLQQMG